jgi:non-heme Fe2+,alpha-ketoglutarate-dependent halogenase
MPLIRMSTPYEEQGYLGPIEALAPAELESSALLAFVRSIATGPDCLNRHLDVPAVAAVCRSPKIVEAVRGVLGPDLVVWRSTLFSVSADNQRLPWHNDEYRALVDCTSGGAHCSVQINLTDSSQSNCVAIVPGSHRWDDAELERRGYGVVPPGDWNTEGVSFFTSPPEPPLLEMPLRAGQFYVFHPRLLHASIVRRAAGGDPVDVARCSIALRIATTGAKILPKAFANSPSRATCVLLSGADRSGTNPLGTWAA